MRFAPALTTLLVSLALTHTARTEPLVTRSTAPILSVQITSPQDGATVAGNVVVTGTSSDAIGVAISIDSGPFQLAQGTDNWTFAFDTTAVSDGTHTIRARAREFVGGPAVFDSIQVNVSNTGGLSVAITDPADGALVLDTFVLSGTSSGATAVTLSVDGGPPQATNGLSSWTAIFEPGALSSGPHTLTASATDGVGTVSAAITVTVGDPLPGSQQITYLSSVDGAPMGAELYVPANLDLQLETALVIHLHGGGGTGNVSAAMAAELDARGWIGLAPDGRDWALADQGCPWNTSSAYVDSPNPDAGPGEQDIFDAIDWARSTFAIDPDRVYLTGFSLGGRGTYIIGLKNPDQFAAIAPMGPASDMFEVHTRRPEPCICKDGITAGGPSEGPVPATLNHTTSGRFLLENAYNLPVFHAHGLFDTVASNTLSAAPYLHGWHMVTDTSFNAAHVTPSTNAAWGNSCFTGTDADLPLSFGFGHTPTLSELAGRHPGGYDWALMFTQVAHTTDPAWLQGAPITAGAFGTEDPLNPGTWIGIYEFFDRHTRVTSPDTVLFKTYEDEHEQAYWATIVSATPWLATPAAVRARRDLTTNHLDVELARAAEVRFDLDLAGLALLPGSALTIELERLVDPVYDPALDSTGEALLPAVVLAGDFTSLAGVTVTRDGNLLPASLVDLAPDRITVGPVDLGSPATLVVAVAESHCAALPNSTGSVAQLGLDGPASVSANALSLDVVDAVPFTNGLFFYGAQRTALPFGDGVLCVTPPLARLSPPQQADVTGSVARALDFSQPPLSGSPAAVLPGSLWSFQYWYRDPSGGANGFNLSTAVEIEFVP